MKGKTLSKAARAALHRVRQERWFNAFAKKAEVDKKTLRKMYLGKYVELEKVQRVEAALGAPATVVTAEIVETMVSTGYGLTIEALHRLRQSSNQVIREAQQVTYLLLESEAKMKRTAIAKHFGFADHSNISHNIATIQERLQVEKRLQQTVKRIQAKILAA